MARQLAGKQVDLVYYRDGVRIVVGKASITEDGAITGQINKDTRQEVKDLPLSIHELAFSLTEPPPALRTTYAVQRTTLSTVVPTTSLPTTQEY